MGNNRKASNTIEQGLQIQHRVRRGDKYKRARGYKCRGVRDTKHLKTRALVSCKQNRSGGGKVRVGGEKLSVSKLQLADESSLLLL